MMNNMALIDFADEEEFFDCAIVFSGGADHDLSDGEVFLDASGEELPDGCEGYEEESVLSGEEFGSVQYRQAGPQSEYVRTLSVIEEEGFFDDNSSFDMHGNETYNTDEICEEFDFRDQEIEVPDWAVGLFGLPHAGKWTVYEIADYDSLDREGGQNNIPQGFDFRDQEIDVPEWAVGMFGLPHAGKFTVFQIAGYDPLDEEAGQKTITRDYGTKKKSWIKRVALKGFKRFTKGCFGGCVAIRIRPTRPSKSDPFHHPNLSRYHRLNNGFDEYRPALATGEHQC